VSAAPMIQFGRAGKLGEGVESYDGRKPRERTRLLASEHAPIRYIFCEWAGEAGMGSSAAQLERLAALPELLGPAPADEDKASQRIRLALDREWLRSWQRAWEKDGQVMVAHGSPPAFRDTYSATEAWTDRMVWGARSTRHGRTIHQSLRALRALDATRKASLVVLYALYGGLPPGLISETLWAKDVNGDYVRVLRFVDGAPTPIELESTLRDEKRRASETEAQWRARRPMSEATRWALLDGLGRKCEALIVRATEDYRAAWSEAV
jgi:hypothetical protein